jgi:Predicted membrane protein (DUF2127)
MERHVKVIGLVQIIFSSLFLLAGSAAGAMFVFMGSAADSALQSGSSGQPAHVVAPGDREATEFMGAINHAMLHAGWFVVIIAILWGGIGIAAGIGLLRRAPWGRVLGIVASIMNILLLNPLHIGIGIYGLVVLTDKATVALFEGSAPAVPSGTAPTG